MNALALALGLMDLFNKATPGIASFIGIVRGKDGKMTVVSIIDDTDATDASVIEMVAKWKAEHGG